MNDYLKHIINPNLKRIINQDFNIPYVDDYNNVSDYWYPHPPCLIPLFLGYGASYKGVIHHFFCDRKSTFVEYYLEHGFMSEIARNSEQFMTLLVLKMIMIKEEITSEILEFCKKVNFSYYNEVDSFTLEYGDDPNEFDKLIFFNKNYPFKHIKDLSKYDGDFPSYLTIINESQLENASIFEISTPEKLDEIKIPSWLKKEVNKKDLFNKYLSENKLKEAWFTLNSTGWKLVDVSNALKELKSKSNDEFLNLVSNNWIKNWEQSSFLEGSY